MAFSELGMGFTWFYGLGEIGVMSPSDKDDILLDVVVQGLTKMVKGKRNECIE